MPPEQDQLENEEVSLRSALESAFDEAAEPAEQQDDQPTDDQDVDENGQPRDERGRWTKAQREHYEAQQREQQEQQQQQEQEQQGQQQELRMAPPHGWSPAAKAAFAKLPPEVQEAVARREVEINNGFAKLKDFKGLEEYAEIARSSGTTLKEAFDRYKAAEDLLDRDFRGGVMQLCEMYGVHPMQLANEFAAMFTGQRGAPRAPAMDPQTGLIARELAGMKETVRTLISEREQQEQEAINAHLQSFAENKMYFENVRQDMADLIRSGRANDLEDAYDKACWMNPEIRDLLIKERAAPQEAEARVSKARRASGSLPTGAPAGTSSPSSNNSIRAALEDAWGSSAL
jgi:hypothetical protein